MANQFHKMYLQIHDYSKLITDTARVEYSRVLVDLLQSFKLLK